MVVRSTHHQTAWELLGTVDSKLVRRVERKIPLILLSDGICRQDMWKVCIIAAHYEVTMSGALMANYYISWRLKNNVMSSKYLVMRLLHDH